MVQRETLRSKLNTAVLDWTTACTAHAVQKAARSTNSFLRVFWVVCFVASMTYCIYSVVISTRSYLANRTYISTQLISESPTMFPAVTFCNVKMLNKYRAKDYIQNVFSNLNVSSVYRDDGSISPIRFVYSNLYLMKAVLENDKNLTQETKESFGFNFTEMIISCAFNWRDCTEEDFHAFYHPMYGGCYTFNLMNNSAKFKRSSIEGGDYGLMLEIFTGLPSVQTEYEFNDGIIVVVHNQSTLPSLNSDRVLISTGAETDVKINRNFIVKLGSPYGNCLKNVEMKSSVLSPYSNDQTVNFNITYSQKYCLLVCLQKHVIRECNCSIALLPKLKNDTSCSTLNEIACITRVTQGFNSPGASDTCKEKCPLECDLVEYSISTSRLTYPSAYYKKQLARNRVINRSGIAYDDIDKAVLKLNVFYETLSYNLIEERPSTTPETFFSNVGGLLGLCLGVSVISSMEIFELLLKLIEITRKHRAAEKLLTKVGNE